MKEYEMKVYTLKEVRDLIDAKVGRELYARYMELTVGIFLLLEGVVIISTYAAAQPILYFLKIREPPGSPISVALVSALGFFVLGLVWVLQDDIITYVREKIKIKINEVAE